MRRGLTIAELLVWSLLSLVVLGVAAVLLWQVLRSTARGSAMGQLQQSGATAMARLIADLQHTTAKAVTLAENLYASDPEPFNCAAIQRRVQVDGQGRSTYADHTGLVLYCWSRGAPVLRRRSWPGAAPAGVPLNTNDPARLSDAQLRLLIADSSALETRIPYVTEFRLYSPDVTAPNLANPLELALELRQRTAANLAEEVFRLHRTIVLRNSL